MAFEIEAPLTALDRKSIHQELMKRPSMYLGVNRLDYLQLFVDGFCMGRSMQRRECGMPSLPDDWADDYELQYWLLEHQSVAARGGSAKWGMLLFYRTFGTDLAAMKQYANFLHAEIPRQVIREQQKNLESAGTVAVRLQERYEEIKHMPPKEHVRQLVELIEGLIAQRHLYHDQLRVYIHRDPYFSQVRFVYHTETGWHHDEELIAKPQNHETVLSLHAHLEAVDEDRMLREAMIPGKLYLYVNDDRILDYGKRGERVFDLGHYVGKEECFQQRFEQWRLNMTFTY